MRKFEEKKKDIVVQHQVYRVVTVGDLRKILNDEGFKKTVKDDALVWCETKSAVNKLIVAVSIEQITGPDLEEEMGFILTAYNDPKRKVNHNFDFYDKKTEEQHKEEKEQEERDAKYGTINALKFLKEEEAKPSDPPTQPV